MLELNLDKKNNVYDLLQKNDSKTILNFLAEGKIAIDGEGLNEIKVCSFCGSKSKFFYIHLYPKRWLIVGYEIIYYCKECYERFR